VPFNLALCLAAVFPDPRQVQI